MPPKLSFLLTLIGLAAAGLPLLHLTRPAEHHHSGCCGHDHAAHSCEHAAEHAAAYADLRFDGAATVNLRHRGQSLGSYSSSPAELKLPAGARELEVEAHWAESGEHAVTLSFELPHAPAQSCTRWVNGTELHDIFFIDGEEPEHEHR